MHTDQKQGLQLVGQFRFPSSRPRYQASGPRTFSGGDHEQYRPGVRGRETGKDGGDEHSARFSGNS